jgi:uncharacterized protein (DUF302 family)
MYQEMSFDEWFAKVKIEFDKHGLSLPDDIEMMELSHMECAEEEKSIEQFVKEVAAEQKGMD